MTPCKDCNKNINPSSDTTLQWTGGDYSDLGIQNNTSLKTVLGKILDKLNEQPSKIEGATTDQIKSTGNLLNLTSKTSNCSNTITNRNMSYASKGSLTGLDFTYNLAEAINNLPLNIGVLAVDVSVVGTASYGPVNILNTNKTVSGVTIAVDKLPATANFKVFLNTPCGNIELVKRVLINAEVANQITTFDINDTNSSSKEVYTQSDINQILIENLNTAQRQIDNLKQQIDNLTK